MFSPLLKLIKKNKCPLVKNILVLNSMNVVSLLGEQDMKKMSSNQKLKKNKISGLENCFHLMLRKLGHSMVMWNYKPL